MRERARRVFGYAVLASLLLHALVFYVLPAAREFAALVPPEPEPLIARVEQLEPPPPAPVPAVKPRPKPKPEPAAPPEVAKPVPEERIATVPPVPEPATPAPAPAPEPRPATQPPAPAPSPQPRVEPPAPSAQETAITRFRESLLDRARRDKRYPRVAVDNLWEGTVAVRMSIGADGRIAALRVTRGSGHAVLDREALRLFGAARSQVPVPRELRGQAFEIDIEAVYDLTDQRSG